MLEIHFLSINHLIARHFQCVGDRGFFGYVMVFIRYCVLVEFFIRFLSLISFLVNFKKMMVCNVVLLFV